jgi:predicted transcriptional regulator/ribosome-binding protein aMBF1 (putative translation factor)
MSRKPVFLGKRVRALRIRAGFSQANLAAQLDISASYLNQLEHDRRPITTSLLLGLANALDIDVRALAAGADADLLGSLTELFHEPVFEDHPLTGKELGAFVEANPDVARAVVWLHRAYANTRTSLATLAERLLEDPQEIGDYERSRLSPELVSDFIQRHGNYFPALESAAEELLSGIPADDDLFARLAGHLRRTHGVTVRIITVDEMQGAVRRYFPDRRELQLSEALRRGSRNLQLAVQIGLIECASILDTLTVNAQLNTEESRVLCRVALAGYFAAAVLMPYEAFLKSAEKERYDVELLGHRFRVGWEHVCHRLTTLRRPGALGVQFYMMRVDLAGNITKRYSAAGIRFPRFSGLCSLWNVHSAFLQPGRVRVQLSRLPDGHTVLAVAKTVQRHSGGYLTVEAPYAVGIGCDASEAHLTVYGDGIDLSKNATAVPIGITCRMCERADCTARAVPSLGATLRIDENVRGVSFFAPIGGKGKK